MLGLTRFAPFSCTGYCDPRRRWTQRSRLLREPFRDQLAVTLGGVERTVVPDACQREQPFLLRILITRGAGFVEQRSTALALREM